MFFFDALQEALSEIGDAFFEVLYSTLKGGDIGRRIVNEEVQDGGELFRLGQVGLKDEFVVLVKDGAAGILEDGVDCRIACADLFADFSIQIIFGIFSLPVATWEVEAIT